ncbi:MmgE/PrpD family protein [Bradyrhizobium sp. KB893862 SZCCT0404]|uniref:MmgE/PrpD family protein n=1 Tax=Bradyrhizobium sp. KB893862 SZCCT0404 TaxID=2807672 RepID=UPI001BAC8A66|nr:MmgE/PrpD family protein [Bradyrhizobium sp. KB893862 SZCCT0404]MBR1175325.1 MmgE/PrpD family protein [Bradyrhizobium sp. KB893862 SZCCT0404]
MGTILSRRTLSKGILASGCLPFVLGGRTLAASNDLAARLADYASSLRYGDLPPSTVVAAKAHLIDAIGCGIAALGQEPVVAVRALADTVNGPCTILGSAKRTSVEWAAFANGCAIREFDLNDFYSGRDTGHPSDHISACLAVAEMSGSDGKEVVTAIVLAYEIMCRLLDGPSLRSRGFDHPAYSLVAVALAAGRLMKLSPSQLAQAVNIALGAHIPLFQTRSDTISNWKGMADAEAARTAIFSVLLASKGISGPSPIFEGKAGFMRAVSGEFELDLASFGGKSRPFKIEDVRYKFYPAQAFIQTAVPAAAAISHRINGAKIRKVEVATTKSGKDVAANGPEKWAPKTSETADHSLPFVVVRTLLDGQLSVHSYSEKAISDPEAVALLNETTVVEDAALTAMTPAKAPNRITVTLDDGRILSEQRDDLPGFPGHPVQRSDIEEKFENNVGDVWPADQRRRVLEMAWSLEEHSDVGSFMQGLAITGR